MVKTTVTTYESKTNPLNATWGPQRKKPAKNLRDTLTTCASPLYSAGSLPATQKFATNSYGFLSLPLFRFIGDTRFIQVTFWKTWSPTYCPKYRSIVERCSPGPKVASLMFSKRSKESNRDVGLVHPSYRKCLGNPW